jgi:hypothetical protein
VCPEYLSLAKKAMSMPEPWIDVEEGGEGLDSWRLGNRGDTALTQDQWGLKGMEVAALTVTVGHDATWYSPRHTAVSNLGDKEIHS